MIKPVEPKKILCIHDLSGVGRCSLAVILPVLSVMGAQPVALPTVVLSTQHAPEVTLEQIRKDMRSAGGTGRKSLCSVAVGPQGGGPRDGRQR